MKTKPLNVFNKKKKIFVCLCCFISDLAWQQKSINANINLGLDSASISLTFVNKIDLFEV